MLIYIPEVNKRGKLNNIAEKLCFNGYSLQTKGYRLFDNIFAHRDVIFNESDFNIALAKQKALMK